MSSAKKILIVHNYYQISGGEDTVVANELKLLQEHGHEVTLYKRHNSELNSMSKIEKLKLPFTTIYNRKTYKDIVSIIHDKQIDVVHVHNTLNLISPAVYYAAVKCGVPVVQTIHNFRLLCPKATLYRDGHICEDCINKGLMCSVMHKCYRNSLFQTLACAVTTKIHRMTGIYRKINYICLTEFNRKKLSSVNKIGRRSVIDEDKIFVKPNFMPCEGNGIIPELRRKRQFIYAGRLDETKGVDILLNAWRGIQTDGANEDLQLVICGTGPMEDDLKQFIADNKLRNVVLKGSTPHEEVLKIMGESLAMVLPTRWYEGFPMSIAESYSVGTPVIGPEMGNVGNIILDGITGYKYSESDASGLSKVLEMIASGKHNHNIYDGAYNEYISKYTDEINYTMLEKIYDDCISVYNV